MLLLFRFLLLFLLLVLCYFSIAFPFIFFPWCNVHFFTPLPILSVSLFLNFVFFCSIIYFLQFFSRAGYFLLCFYFCPTFVPLSPQVRFSQGCTPLLRYRRTPVTPLLRCTCTFFLLVKSLLSQNAGRPSGQNVANSHTGWSGGYFRCWWEFGDVRARNSRLCM